MRKDRKIKRSKKNDEMLAEKEKWHSNIIEEINAKLDKAPSNVELLSQKAANLIFMAHNLYYISTELLQLNSAKITGACIARDKLLHEALEIYEHIIMLSPNHIETHIDLGDYWNSQGENERALLFYDKAISIFNKCGQSRLKGEIDDVLRKRELLRKQKV